MDCFLLKKGFDTEKLIKDYLIAEANHAFINPEVINEKSFSLSKETHGWEAIPLHTVDGITGNEGTIPVSTTDKLFKPNEILLKCKYFQKILDDLDTEIYLVRLMKLKAGGYVAPHTDNLLNDNVIRCHLPIITNSDVHFYIGNENKIDYDLKAGNLYYINAKNAEHYVKNNSKVDRVNLVIDLNPNDLIKKIL
jgi:aspartyl/asparaginyl beta-hydroxylase (cupin superfamily)